MLKDNCSHFADSVEAGRGEEDVADVYESKKNTFFFGRDLLVSFARIKPSGSAGNAISRLSGKHVSGVFLGYLR